MKSRGREILERQPITVFTTKQKYMTQCFVTQCDSFTHGDVKINKSERYYPSYCQRCNETGQDLIFISSFLFNNLNMSSDYIPALQPSAIDRS